MNSGQTQAGFAAVGWGGGGWLGGVAASKPTKRRFKMAQGDQVKSLIIVSKARGWDPTRIYDKSTDSYGESIANFNKAPEIYTNQAGTGSMPGGTPDGWPDSFGPPKTPSVEPNERDWQQGATNDNQKRGTSGANPYAGKMEG